MKFFRCTVFWLCLLSFSAGAQEKRPMTLVDRLEVPVLSDPQLSPDGEQLAYVLSRADWKANKRISHIWRTNTDGSGSRQLTNGEEGERSPRWAPDGRHIAFLAKRGEAKATQIYLILVDGGEAQQLTHHKTSVSRISWSPDGTAIYFVAADPKSEEQEKREKAKDDVFAFDENYQQRHLWRVTVANGEETRLTGGDFSVRGYALSRDGRKIVLHRAPTPLVGDAARSEIWVMDARGENAQQLTHNDQPEYGARLSPDNRQVLYISWCNEKFEPYYNNNLFVMPAEGGAPRLLLPDLPYEMRQAVWSRNGQAIYFAANMGVHTELFRVDPKTEKYVQLTEGKHSLRGWSFQPRANRHVFSLRDLKNDGDVWMLPADEKTSPVRISHVYDYLDQQFLLPRVEAIHWQGRDGVTVEGLLYYPVDYEKGKTYPLVVQTHGGPASADQYGLGGWSVYRPVLAGRGYAVLSPNYRGSTGYGDAFLRDMVGGYFRQAHLDVMAGVDHVMRMGIADSTKLIKMGWSAGGHMTNKIITFTTRFKAASSGAGAVNWISMYGQSDTRLYRTPWFGGTPWQKDAPIDIYWAHSPLKDIWKVKTPTLILVGEKDVRVPPPQSVELYRALKANGVPTRLYIAPREPHGWRELRHELFKMNAELAWFEKYAMGREYVWEKAPEGPRDEARD